MSVCVPPVCALRLWWMCGGGRERIGVCVSRVCGGCVWGEREWACLSLAFVRCICGGCVGERENRRVCVSRLCSVFVVGVWGEEREWACVCVSRLCGAFVVDV